MCLQEVYASVFPKSCQTQKLNSLGRRLKSSSKVDREIITNTGTHVTARGTQLRVVVHYHEFLCVCVYVREGVGRHIVTRTRLHQHSGGTGSAPANYLPQLAGGCVALGTTTSSGTGGPRYNYQGGYHRHGQWPPVAPYPFVHFCPFVCECVCVCVF